MTKKEVRAIIPRMETLRDRVLRYINTNMHVPRGSTVILSLSAGKDSMCMLDVLNSLRDRLSIELTAFHLNHMTRGVESRDDERFVTDRCAAYNVPIVSRHFDFHSHAGTGTSFEEHARDVRYSMLEEIASSMTRCGGVATAHTIDDGIETVLMRIFTGTGVHGLRGIDPSRGIYIRPLLCIRSGEAYRYLEERGLPWREDISNQDDRHSRNFIRNTILPVISEKFPMAARSIIALSDQSRETMNFLRRLIEDRYGPLYRVDNDCAVIDAHAFGSDRNSLAEAVAAAIRDKFGTYITRAIINEIGRKLFVQRTNMILYENVEIIVSKRHSRIGPYILIQKNTSPGCNNSKWEYTLTDITSEERDIVIQETGSVLHVRLVDMDYFHDHRNEKTSSFLELQENDREILIRNRRDGDRIELEIGSKKIKDYFIEKKLDSIQKDGIILIIVRSSIAAVIPGNQADMPARVTLPFKVKDSSRKILAVRW